MIKSKKLSIILGSVAFCLSVHAATDFQADNILISSNNTLYEYNPNGELISQIAIPIISTEKARDMIILENGDLAVYNGTFTPQLSVYNGSDWSTYTVDGWSTVNNGTYGGITNIGDTVYLTDHSTYNDGDTQGLIAFDLNSNTSQRFLESHEYIDITLGEDNLLYALRNFYGDLDVIDPVSYEVLRTLDLGHTSSSRSVTANRDGLIYMVSWSGYIAQYDTTGILIKTLTLGNNTHDIDIDNNGNIVVGGRSGEIYLTDESLNSYTQILVSSSNTFVAFTTPVQYEPTPEAPVLTGSHRKRGRNIVTTLNWTTQAPAVDVYFNGELLETLNDTNTATYYYFKKLSQEFMVCNIGTLDCSEPYTSR
jgi:hypothetical protein